MAFEVQGHCAPSVIDWLTGFVVGRSEGRYYCFVCHENMARILKVSDGRKIGVSERKRGAVERNVRNATRRS